MNICAISDHLIRNIPYVTYHNKYIYIKESFKKTCAKNVGKKDKQNLKRANIVNEIYLIFLVSQFATSYKQTTSSKPA